METYNVNELLEKKKMLEGQVKEKIMVEPEMLRYTEKKIIDHATPKNTRTVVPRQKQNLVEFSRAFFGMVDELKKVKTVTQEYNAKHVLGMLQERESIRTKHAYLGLLRQNVIREKKFNREVTREDKDGVALESEETTIEPMFTREEIEALMDKLAAQERKINTEIQRINLNAKIKIK